MLSFESGETIMSTQFDRVAADAMKLPVRDRVRLAQQLVSTIDSETEKNVEELWFDEAERRLEELHSGTVEGIETGEAFRRVREDLT
jgi:putative addiction module component (TIGR02574 family)